MRPQNHGGSGIFNVLKTHFLVANFDRFARFECGSVVTLWNLVQGLHPHADTVFHVKGVDGRCSSARPV